MDLLTRQEVALLLNVSENTGTAILARNKIPKVGRGRYERESVLRIKQELDERKKIKKPIWIEGRG